MSSLLCTRMTGVSTMEPGLITYIVDYFVCIRVRNQKDVSRLPIILITHWSAMLWWVPNLFRFPVCVHWWHAAGLRWLIVAIPTPARKWSIRLFKTIGFLLISLMVGRTLEPAEFYLNHDVASSVCDFIYGDVNAETLYDTYTYIDILTVFTLTTVIYRLTMLLINRIRK